MEYIDYYEVIRKNIIVYRKLAKLNQFELAMLCNSSKSTISKIENEIYKQHVSIEKYYLIADALGISITDLLEPNFDEVFSNTLPIIKPRSKVNINFNYDYYNNLIISNLVNWRIIKKLTQEELAEKSSISVNFLRNIETKKKGFTLETLGKLSKGLDIDIRLLFKEND